MESMPPVTTPDVPAPPPIQVERPGTRLLPVFEAPVTDRVWLVAAHGGAGCSTVYASSPGLYADAGRALPFCADPAPRIVLCAMGSAHGLESLRALLAEWDAGALAPCVLLGVAVTTCMARPPRALRRGCLQVGSVAPHLWRLPYVASIPVEGRPSSWPSGYRRMSSALEGARR